MRDTPASVARVPSHATGSRVLPGRSPEAWTKDKGGDHVPFEGLYGEGQADIPKYKF